MLVARRLNLLLATDSGQAYSEGEIRKMLEAAGITDVRRHPFQGPTGSGVIFGIR